MTKRKGKKEKLLKALQENEKLSTKEIQGILEADSKSTVRNYIEGLQSEGYEIECEVIPTGNYYRLKQDTALQAASQNLSYHIPIDKKIIRNYFIMNTLQERPMSAKEMIRALGKDNILSLTVDELNRILQKLVKSKDVICPERNGKYYLTAENTFFFLSMKSSQSDFLHQKLNSIPNSHPNYKHLKSIRDKLSLILDLEQDGQDNTMISYGKRYSRSYDISAVIERLAKFDYKKKAVDIEYISNKKRKQMLESQNSNQQIKKDRVILAIAMIVYSFEKDKIYLMGKQLNRYSDHKASGNYIIAYGDDMVIKKTEIDNEWYQSSYFMDIYHEMFSISTDSDYEVAVEFEKIGNIEQKIRLLCENRKYVKDGECFGPQITDKGDTFIYQDRIRGLYDFLNYIREFGMSAKVISPPELVEIVKKSVIRGLGVYQIKVKNE